MFKICDFTVDYITQAQELLRQGYERERGAKEGSTYHSVTHFRRELSYHLTKAPCFCLHNEAQFEEYITDRETSEGLVTLGLYNSADELIGLIDTTEDDGENFVSQGSGILNISGMFVREDYRGKGYARLLVDAAVEEAKNLDDFVLGVDYETLNPTARCFWEKYFTPYTISLVRRVDVRGEISLK